VRARASQLATPVQLAADWSSHGKMTRQGPGNANRPVGLLVEVAFRKARIREPRGEPAIDTRANCFHRVLGKGGATSCVGVRCRGRRETDAGQGDSQLTRENASGPHLKESRRFECSSCQAGSCGGRSSTSAPVVARGARNEAACPPTRTSMLQQRRLQCPAAGRRLWRRRAARRD
jgi:hypothetical protein